MKIGRIIRRTPNLGNHDSSIIKAIHEQDNIAPSNVPTHNLHLVTTDKRRVSIMLCLLCR